MQIIHAQEPAPSRINKSIFLIGPTPRDGNAVSRRPQALAELEQQGFDGVVFSPERNQGWRGSKISAEGGNVVICHARYVAEGRR